jgi:glycosyltransferase involved in cell wall biosynthesis
LSAATPRISVVIPTFNRRETILEAVLSVLRQTDGETGEKTEGKAGGKKVAAPEAGKGEVFPGVGDLFELLVVDDGSDDGTEEVLAPYRESLVYLKTADADGPANEEGAPRVPGVPRVPRVPRNKGVSFARNLGIKASKGKYVAFLDSDDFWLPGKLGKQWEFMEENPDLLFSQCLERWIRNGRFANPKKRHLKEGGRIFLRSLRLCLISPSAVIMRREFFGEVGLFDEEMPVCEDYDLWLRALVRHPAGLLEEELAVRRNGAPDQLSARHSPDFHRMKSLRKILALPDLPPEYAAEAEKVLAEKTRVYENGLRKRGLAPGKEPWGTPGPRGD